MAGEVVIADVCGGEMAGVGEKGAAAARVVVVAAVVNQAGRTKGRPGHIMLEWMSKNLMSCTDHKRNHCQIMPISISQPLFATSKPVIKLRMRIFPVPRTSIVLLLWRCTCLTCVYHYIIIRVAYIYHNLDLIERLKFSGGR